ncbi:MULTISPECIES: type II toxin-antitoxin system VapC family toxin [Cysteiniphilum]|uniref:type II toxin-antitoxin system VapC family toxin n=1 Tax=Cysteiniphilum TaxID=2056696 RepID=UPI0017825532|nr:MULTISPECIES: type II toxin-antitoxin system VapC family toxin [Cysteiniphilum]
MYLLDTNVISYLINKKQPYSEHLKIRLAEHQPAKIFISNLIIHELYSGYQRINDNDQLYKERVKSAIDHMISTLNIIEYTGTEVAKLSGKIMGNLIAKGSQIQAIDTMLASQAIINDMTFISNDAHFKRIEELKLENWCVSNN